MSPPPWIFGYGSLVWRPAFPFADRRVATLRGFSRRFWQGSTDHRGVPGAPGRVVTLVPEPHAACIGVAYRPAPESASEVLERLDHRERGGYVRLEVSLELAGGREEARGLVYVATAANPDYLGPASLEGIARQIGRARGPSGPNREYLLRLAEALRSLGAHDDHVFALEALIRRESTGEAPSESAREKRVGSR